MKAFPLNLVFLALLYALVFFALLYAYKGPTINNIGIGLPATWNGDKFGLINCPAINIPEFLDGYFLCQLAASYGNVSDLPGQKLDHMIDALGAIGSFRIKNGKVTFYAQYYPAKPYKIWDFYSRDMRKSSVPFFTWSYYNLTAMNKWALVPPDPNMASFHPNIHFWKIGNTILGGTETPWVGYEFNIHTLTDFKLFPFIENNTIYNNPHSNITPIMTSIHEHKDENGVIWAAFNAVDFVNMHSYQGIFTVDNNGVRRVVGLFDYGQFDYKYCDSNNEYLGDPRLFSGYVHSLAATQNYIIIPINSLLFNPCKLSKPPTINLNEAIQKGSGFHGGQFYENVPFSKKLKQFITDKPIEASSAMFVTHQLNAYEIDNFNLVADMIVYPNTDPYFKYLNRGFLTTQLSPNIANITRFLIKLNEENITSSVLNAQSPLAVEYPQINQAYNTKRYNWGYLVENVYSSGNSILKINVDDPSGKQNLRYRADDNVNLHEPIFIQRPNSIKEDDGVLLIRGLNVATETSILIVVDARTMTKIGSAHVPIPIPLGFHNRYFSL